jgi:hypothetical protein
VSSATREQEGGSTVRSLSRATRGGAEGGWRAMRGCRGQAMRWSKGWVGAGGATQVRWGAGVVRGEEEVRERIRCFTD